MPSACYEELANGYAGRPDDYAGRATGIVANLVRLPGARLCARLLSERKR